MDRETGREARAGEPTLVHVNGIYIKAAQISSWVLNVRGSKKPFRHAASPLIVKIGALVLCSCRLWKAGGGRHMSSQFSDFEKATRLRFKWHIKPSIWFWRII